VGRAVDASLGRKRRGARLRSKEWRAEGRCLPAPADSFVFPETFEAAWIGAGVFCARFRARARCSQSIPPLAAPRWTARDRSSELRGPAPTRPARASASGSAGAAQSPPNAKSDAAPCQVRHRGVSVGQARRNVGRTVLSAAFDMAIDFDSGHYEIDLPGSRQHLARNGGKS
jgi:hypothetical protein